MRLLSATEVSINVRKEEETQMRRATAMNKEVENGIRTMNAMKANVEQAKLRLVEELEGAKRSAAVEMEAVLGQIRVLEAKRDAIAESLEERRWKERHDRIELQEAEIEGRLVSVVQKEELLKLKTVQLSNREKGIMETLAQAEEKERRNSMMHEANKVILESLSRQTEEMKKETARLEKERTALQGAYDEARHDLLTNSAYKN